MMLTRRALLAFGAACSLFVVAPLAWAEEETAADAFIQDFGTKLVAVVNGDGSLEQKQDALRPLIERAVDVDTIAHFCLGRFANTATPEQIAEYTKLFHHVLIDNITSKIGEFRGVTFKMGDTTMKGNDALVGTIVTRPNQAPTDVRWVVTTIGGSPRIIDVIAEGTSLRLTQRSDYSSFMSHHGNEVDGLIKAMRQQVAAQG
jgi:phospholipid transport system substrate-binding protein